MPGAPWGEGRTRQRPLTSDKDVGGVGLVSGLGGDAEGVQALVLLVEVREGQGGAVSAPVHLVPLAGRQQLVWSPGRRSTGCQHTQRQRDDVNSPCQ